MFYQYNLIFVEDANFFINSAVYFGLLLLLLEVLVSVMYMQSGSSVKKCNLLPINVLKKFSVRPLRKC